MKNSGFHSRQFSDLNLRKSFFTDVGKSTLNLIDLLGLGHEDTQQPNITVKGNSFHLINFDNCLQDTQFNSSPLIIEVHTNKERLR